MCKLTSLVFTFQTIIRDGILRVFPSNANQAIRHGRSYITLNRLFYAQLYDTIVLKCALQIKLHAVNGTQKISQIKPFSFVQKHR